MPLNDPIEALIALRNGLSHGNADVHSPGLAMGILKAVRSGSTRCFRTRLDDYVPLIAACVQVSSRKGKAFPCGRAHVSADPFCSDVPATPRKR